MAAPACIAILVLVSAGVASTFGRVFNRGHPGEETAHLLQGVEEDVSSEFALAGGCLADTLPRRSMVQVMTEEPAKGI